MTKPKITVKDLKTMDRETLPPDIVGRVLGVDPQWIRGAARQHPEWLGFPVIVCGTRTLVPRLALIRYLEGKSLTKT